MRDFIYTAEFHLVVLIEYRHFFWRQGMDTVFGRGRCVTLSAMSRKIPLPLTVHTHYLSLLEKSSVNHCDVASLKAL